METSEFKVAKTEPLEPDNARSGDIFSRLGYKFADAIADLVDNSADAHAKHVHIRFVRDDRGIRRVLVADDGDGMDAAVLREAMRFGSRGAKNSKQLGKYGIGLKSASLSQAETVVVLTKQGNAFLGRRWTLENVKANWNSEILAPESAATIFKMRFGDIKHPRSGTVVIWERLEHLQTLPSNVDDVLDRTTRELNTELGIRFHRFIESGVVKISIDQQLGAEEPLGFPLLVMALDPFSYERSGRSNYPLALRLHVSGQAVDAVCHIWPPKSKLPGYRLGRGKVALRQGFYFYRNDRIIQAGGWNGLRADDGEPHLSLARVRIELPAILDGLFKLDVTKSHLDPAPEFVSALLGAAKQGVTFEKYLDHAEGVYRGQKKRDARRFPFVPGTGLSAKAQRAIGNILDEPGTSRPTKISFKWARLDHDEIFRADREREVILLNRKYRSYLAEGGTGDSPVLKTTLLFLLQDELEKVFFTQKAMDWMQRVNQSLLASMKE